MDDFRLITVSNKTSQRTEDPVIPIFRPAISEEEIASVEAVLRSPWLGPGPRARELESAFAKAVGSNYAISTASGSAALTALLVGLGVKPGDEVILPSFTYFSAFQILRGLEAVPVFADIEAEFLTLDPADVARRLTPRTKGIINVHHGGQLSDMDALCALAEKAGAWLIDDAAHAAGAAYHGRPVGSIAHATVFSFSAVKNLTTGDGGMVTTNDKELARRLVIFRNLGLCEDTWDRYGDGTDIRINRWAYKIGGYGQRIHMNDIASALGIVQLNRLGSLNQQRAELVRRYEEAFSGVQAFRSIKPRKDTVPSWHMYTVLMAKRDKFIDGMRKRGITVGVHYFPLHLYPIAKPYRNNLKVTEEIWQRVTTFPLYPTMTDSEQKRVIEAARELGMPETAGDCGYL
jgi:perosamine synthetase